MEFVLGNGAMGIRESSIDCYNSIITTTGTLGIRLQTYRHAIRNILGRIVQLFLYYFKLYIVISLYVEYYVYG